MRRLQRLWGSVSVLTAAVLAGICFLRGNTQRIFLIGVFALWIAYFFAVFLMAVIKRYKYRRNLRKIRKKPQNHSGSNGAELQRLYYLLLCNANHRITGYIKSIYPEAVWKWETATPEKVITEGETGRIRLFNVDDYNFADISFDNSANIECTFLKHSIVTNHRQISSRSCELLRHPLYSLIFQVHSPEQKCLNPKAHMHNRLLICLPFRQY